MFEQHNVTVYVKRDDLADPHAGGNKFRKLKAILSPDRLMDKKGLLSFGGPFSNHLVAVAAVASRLGLLSRGVVRGHPVENLVLGWLQTRGMHLTFLPGPEFNEAQISMPLEMPEWEVIPMGGAHPLALTGVAELIPEIRSQLKDAPTHYAIPAGTGTTAAGLSKILESQETLLVFPAIKGPALDVWFREILDSYGINLSGKVFVDTRAPGRGFARKDQELWEFLTKVAQSTGIVFDPVYNGKMAFRIWKLVAEGYFEEGSQLVLIHTGGWPGRVGYQHRYQMESIPGSPELQPDFMDNW